MVSRRRYRNHNGPLWFHTALWETTMGRRGFIWRYGNHNGPLRFHTALLKPQWGIVFDSAVVADAFAVPRSFQQAPRIISATWGIVRPLTSFGPRVAIAGGRAWERWRPAGRGARRPLRSS